MTYSSYTPKPAGFQTPDSPSGIRRFTQDLGLLFGLIGIVFWVLALLGFSALDAAWSTSGAMQATTRNWGGKLGAYLADGSYFWLGFSAWWLLAAAVSVWLRSLARWLRGNSHQPGRPLAATGLKFWFSLALLLAASTGLEWSRLYRFEAHLPDQAGGALGYFVGSTTAKWLGFSGSALVLIGVGLIAVSVVFGFSWARAAQRLGEWISHLLESRREKREIADDLAVGKKAAKERAETLLDERIEIQEQHPVPVTIEPIFVDIPKSDRVIKEKQKPLFKGALDIKNQPEKKTIV